MIIDDNSASESPASNTMRMGTTRGRGTAKGRSTTRGSGTTRGRHDNGIFMNANIMYYE